MSEKMKKKKNWRYHHFTHCTKNYDHMMHDGLTDVWTERQTDRQTDRQTEKVTYRGGCST